MAELKRGQIMAIFADIRNPIPLSLVFGVFGSFAFAGYYSDLLKPYMPIWAAIGVFLLPVLVLVFVVRGELPERVVKRAHIGAALWFLLLAGGMEVGAHFGHRPKELTLYRVLAHLSWSLSWAGVLREALKHRKT